jgi:hypothetical protein
MVRVRSAAAAVMVVTSLSLVSASGCSSTPAANATTPSDAITKLPCQDVIASASAPPSDFSIVFDRVALPTGRALQVSLSGGPAPGAMLFAKEGLLIRRGASFDLVVPPDWRGRVSVGWGSSAKGSSHLRVPGCRPTGPINQPHYQASDDWIAYAGGYWVAEPACVSVVVKAGQAEQTVRIGVGASCPGQAAPPP